MPPGRVYTSEEVAELVHLTPRTVVAKARSGVWPSRRFGTAYSFSEDDLAQIFEIARTAAKPAPAPVGQHHPAPQPRPRTRPADRVVTPPAPGSRTRRLVAKYPKE